MPLWDWDKSMDYLDYQFWKCKTSVFSKNSNFSKNKYFSMKTPFLRFPDIRVTWVELNCIAIFRCFTKIPNVNSSSQVIQKFWQTSEQRFFVDIYYNYVKKRTYRFPEIKKRTYRIGEILQVWSKIFSKCFKNSTKIIL